MSRDSISPDVREVIEHFSENVVEAVSSIEHIYVHGSLAMGGFHRRHSDIDLLLVASTHLVPDEVERLIDLCLRVSNAPYPIELSVVTRHQLNSWQHPSPFAFHFSEGWRERFERCEPNERAKLQDGMTDPDLAAHVKVILERGIVWRGDALQEMLNGFEETHFVDAIRRDGAECLASIFDSPVYSLLNLVRILAYVEDGVILSKQEVSRWLKGAAHFPGNVLASVEKACAMYRGEEEVFSQEELEEASSYFKQRV